MNRCCLTTLLTVTATLVYGTALAKGEPSYRFDQDNTPGWVLMSQAERSEHRSRMLSFKTYDECKAYMDAHRKQIEQRAIERHTTLRPPQADACGEMKARGLIK